MTHPAPELLTPLALGAEDPIVARHVAHCATCQLEVGRLREAAGLLRGPAAFERLAETPECLDELAIADFVEGHLGPEARAPVVDHLLTCAHCRSVVRSTGRLLTDPELSATVRPRPWRRWALPLSLAAAAAVLLLVWPRAEETGVPPATRGTTSGPAIPPVPIAPRASVARVDRFVWSRLPRVDRYRLRLYDAEGNVLWTVETADTSVALPGDVRLSSGVTYFWKVEAQVGWQRWVASDLVGFELGSERR